MVSFQGIRNNRMVKALLIGCGNIGAGYDLGHASRTWTHAKAYASRNDIELSVYDEQKDRALKIASLYNAQSIEVLEDEHYAGFDIVSITSPTSTHFYYLEKCISQGVPVIICEKPVVNSMEQANALSALYQDGRSRILVNYMRRFQPGYELAKQKLNSLLNAQALTGIIIKYKRGFLNNASHAMDLLEFIFDSPFDLENFEFTSAAYDAFEDDPTVVGSGIYHDCPIVFNGITGSSFSIFEIELYFSHSKTVICHSGNEIRYYIEEEGSLKENLDARQTGLLDTYMVPVVDTAMQLLNNKDGKDNFMSSLRLNKEILGIIEPLKNI